VLVVHVLGVALVAGSGSGGSEPASGSGAGGSAALDEPPTIACEVEQLCDLGESMVTVTEAGETDLIATSMGNSEGNFVLIKFDYTYGGTQPATVEDYYWKLEDGKGRTYNYAYDPTSNYEIDNNRFLLYEEINPGTERSGVDLFEVAQDAEDFTLRVRDLIRPQTSKRAEVYF